jgi:hypothetical protein
VGLSQCILLSRCARLEAESHGAAMFTSTCTYTPKLSSDAPPCFRARITSDGQKPQGAADAAKVTCTRCSSRAQTALARQAFWSRRRVHARPLASLLGEPLSPGRASRAPPGGLPSFWTPGAPEEEVQSGSLRDGRCHALDPSAEQIAPSVRVSVRSRPRARQFSVRLGSIPSHTQVTLRQ